MDFGGVDTLLHRSEGTDLDPGIQGQQPSLHGLGGLTVAT